MLGETISHYSIEELLGEGGMGVVYRAVDPRLGRHVAIKLLRGHALADPDRKRRFIQEARAASALNHPNIVMIFEIDTAADGTDFIVMEYVRGRSLRTYIGRKGIPVGEALKYAVQIAGALAAAHEAGIIHRDLKPGNIMITEKGTVKLLDFGLAKLAEPRSVAAEAATQTLAAQTPLTDEGMVVGTAAYMSPEQAQGLPLDPRSDIFSFGSVLYEMLTGRRAFQGANRVSTMTSVLRDEPAPVTETVKFIPPELERAVRRCLRKDREKRVQHIADMKLLLEEFKEDNDSGRVAASGSAVATARRGSRWLLPAVAATCIAIGIAASWFAWRKSASREQTVSDLTNDAGFSGMPALSPDGRLLAFASDRAGDGHMNIWVKQVPGGEPVQITHARGAIRPDFSPDGTRLVYEQVDDASINVVPALGGTPRRIASPGFAPRFSPDGSRVAYFAYDPAVSENQVRVVPGMGGAPRTIPSPLRKLISVVWSRDGKRLLVAGVETPGWFRIEDPTFDWWVVPLDSSRPEPTGLGPKLKGAGFTLMRPDAWLVDAVLFTGGANNKVNVWRQPVDAATRPTGPPVRLTTGATQEVDLAWSPSGLVAFAGMYVGTSSLWMLPLDADNAKPAGELQRVTRTAGYDGNPSVPADGRFAVYQSARTGNTDLWLKDFQTGKDVQLTNTPEAEGRPAVSPDGTRVAYTVRGAAPAPAMRNWVQPIEGGGPERLCDDCGEVRGWFPDNRHLILNINSNTPRGAVGSFDIVTRQAATILQHPELTVGRARSSPDGRWLAFEVTNSPNSRQLFVAPVRDGPAPAAEWIAITGGKTMENKAEWSPNGRWVYFVSDRDGFLCVWARAFDPRARAAKGDPFGILHLHSSEKSMPPINASLFDISVARDKMVFNAVEARANVQAIRLR